MPSVRELSKLFKALALRDTASAETAAIAIISSERKKGHTSAAQALSASLNGHRIRGLRGPEPLTGILSDASLLASALNQREGSSFLNDVMLRPRSRAELDEIIKETKNRDLLQAKGIRRRSKLLFIGPPGCGKSLTAQALSTELGLPLYVVRFDAVIGAYLGQTAMHLREVFQFASHTPCVLLFDEVDALGKQRGNSLDVGELDRIVIAMMQELEFFSSPGLLVATSNLPEALDRALWRRFDTTVTFPTPNKMEVQKYGAALAQRFGVRLGGKVATQISRSSSYAEVEKLIESAARRNALKEL
jgi:SpoVK/Ycf46/Vps4 family AAA+-type ATPase